MACVEAGFTTCRHSLGGPCYGGLVPVPVPSTNGADLGSIKKGTAILECRAIAQSEKTDEARSLVGLLFDQYRRSALVDHKTNCVVAPCLVRRCTWIPNIDHRSCTLGDRSAEDPRHALGKSSLVPRSTYTIFNFSAESRDSKKALRFRRVRIRRGCRGPRYEDWQLSPIADATRFGCSLSRCAGQFVGELERHLELLGRRTGYLGVIGLFSIRDITRANPSSAKGEVHSFASVGKQHFGCAKDSEFSVVGRAIEHDSHPITLVRDIA